MAREVNQQTDEEKVGDGLEEQGFNQQGNMEESTLDPEEVNYE